jgi:carbonic anhydrase
MSEIDRLLASNERYAPAHDGALGAHPARRLAIVTCMDARIDPMAALGLEIGEAHVIRNAGGRVTDDALRSLAVSVHLLGVRAVVVMHHTGCGLIGVSEEELHRRTGASLAFHTIDNPEVALAEDVAKIRGAGFLSSVETLAGLRFDVETGRVSCISRPERVGFSTG